MEQIEITRLKENANNPRSISKEKFMQLVLLVKPSQVTLVPDAPDALTSSAGWNVADNFEFLSQITEQLKEKGIRTSIFVDTNIENIKLAAKVGADRVELYTEPYASAYAANREVAIAPYIEAATAAHKVGLGVNAGHDLNLENLQFFCQRMPYLDEVSIGHALISDALYLGLKETIKQYKNCLK